MARGQKKRNYYDWEGATIAQTALAAAAAVQFALFVGDKAETLVRLRGEWLAQLAIGGSAANDGCVVGFGCIVGSTGAVVGVSPLTDPGANWFWHEMITLHTTGVVGAASVTGDLSGRVGKIDNKAMRKIREDESIFLVVENTSLIGAPGIIVQGAFRALTQS